MRKNTNNRSKNNFKTIFFILISVFLLFVILRKIFFKTNTTSSFINSYKQRNSVDSKYLNRLNHINKNFVMDHNYLVGEKYLERKFYRWNDRTEMSFDKSLSLSLKEYLSEKNISLDDISISVVSLEQSDKFSLNDKYERNYLGIDKLLVNMSIIKMLDNKELSLEDKVSVLQSDIAEDSVFFDKNSVGLTFDIRELINLSFSKNDSNAKNMLKRYLIEKRDTKFNDFLKKEFGIGISNDKTNTFETIKIARELNRHKNIYREILIKNSKKQDVSDFQKYIVNDKIQNFYLSGNDIYYDIGIVESSTPYIYSIYIKNASGNIISQIGDLLDRKINEYYLLKNI